MNDEATTWYQDIIDQMTLGHKWINDTFGPFHLPKIGWQIDSFGHSREFASILSQMAFDGVMLGRVDHHDIVQRKRNQSLEMIWKSSPSLGAKGDIFTSILPNLYHPPDSGFCWETLSGGCTGRPFNDTRYIEEAISVFVDLMKLQARKYRSNHTVVTMGDDFAYVNASQWYDNWDVLMPLINERESQLGIRVFYSTPRCYINSLHQSNLQWPTIDDDFLPYSRRKNQFWVGYFTSRPTFKYLVRSGGNMFQMAKQLHSLLMPGDESSIDAVESLEAIDSLASTMGILQHHDAVTGTSVQDVVNDWRGMLKNSTDLVEQVIFRMFSGLMSKADAEATPFPMAFCYALNETICDESESIGVDFKDAVVYIYNPLAEQVDHYIRLPVIRAAGYRVRNSTGTLLVSQVSFKCNLFSLNILRPHEIFTPLDLNSRIDE